VSHTIDLNSAGRKTAGLGIAMTFFEKLTHIQLFLKKLLTLAGLSTKNTS